MVFNENNVHGQCVSCNTFKEGNRPGYRVGLIKRFGHDILDKLDIARSIKSNPWGVFEYEAMITLYKNKVNELKSISDIDDYNENAKEIIAQYETEKAKKAISAMGEDYIKLAQQIRAVKDTQKFLNLLQKAI